MAEIVAFAYQLAFPQAEKTSAKFISDIEKIVFEHGGETSFPPTTSENQIHERTYDFKPGAIILKMLKEVPKNRPYHLQIRHQNKIYEGTALALLCGFNDDDNNYGVLVEELKMLRARY